MKTYIAGILLASFASASERNFIFACSIPATDKHHNEGVIFALTFNVGTNVTRIYSSENGSIRIFSDGVYNEKSELVEVNGGVYSSIMVNTINEHLKSKPFKLYVGSVTDFLKSNQTQTNFRFNYKELEEYNTSLL